MRALRLVVLSVLLLSWAVPGFTWKAGGHRFVLRVALQKASPHDSLGKFLLDTKRQARLDAMVTWPDPGHGNQTETALGHSHHFDSPTYNRAQVSLDASLYRWLCGGGNVPPPPAPATMQEKRLAYIAHYAADLCCPVHVRRGLDRVSKEEAKAFHGVPELFVERLIASQGPALLKEVDDVANRLAPSGVWPSQGKPPAQEVMADIRYTYDVTSREFDKLTKYHPPAAAANGQYRWEQWCTPSRNVRGVLVRDLARSALTVRKYWVMSWKQPQ
ncbi:hypothetical protein LLH23_13835 [bacterium]|nr:hypothetical protein [bacterium]